MLRAITQQGTVLHIDDRAEIHRGGEGRIVLLNELPGMVAKLYFDPTRALSLAQAQKLQDLDPRCFVAPVELIYDRAPSNMLGMAVAHHALGFTMPYLDNLSHTPLSALFSAVYCQRHVIDNCRKIGIVRQIAAAVAAAHAQNIFIGDLSGLNILLHLPTDTIRLIDTDAYETPAHPHSGILLDDIRDYLYGGRVCRESDYFALAVVAFQLLTHTHPFRGVHRRYSSLSERMIQRLPVFVADADLVPPKCYVPLNAPLLQQQFEAIFVQGSRQLLSLTDADIASAAPVNNKNKTNTITQPILPPLLATNNRVGSLRIQSGVTLADGEWALEVVALPRRLLLRSNLRYLVFDAANAGILRLTHQYNAADFEQVWIGEQQIVAQQHHKLWQLDATRKATPLQNVTLDAQSRYIQYGNCLVVVSNDYLKQIYLDDINGEFIRTEQTAVFGRNFHTSATAIWQQTGGKQYLFYRSGNSLSSVPCDANIKDLYLIDNQVIVADSYIDQGVEKWRYLFGSIHQLQVRLSQMSTETLNSFAYRPLQKGQGWVFEAADNAIIVRRTEDFAALQTLSCPILSQQSHLFYTEAGIVALEQNEVWLLNRQ